jgi:hypothetical protein
MDFRKLLTFWKKPSSKSAAMQALRTRLLTGSAEAIGLKPDGNVWGILLEMGYPQATATLVCLSDGSASLYISNGGGVIGGGEKPAVNAVSRRFVHAALPFVEAMKAVTEFPYPKRGVVKFYVLTTNGVVSTEASEAILQSRDHYFSPLYFAGQDVLSGLREASQAK